MKVKKVGKIVIFAHVQKEPLETPSIRISMEGVSDGTAVSLYKNGRPETAKNYTVQNEMIAPRVKPAKYTLCIGSSKLRFKVYERDGKLYVARSKEDPEKVLETVYNLCIEMLERIDAQDRKFESIDGYVTE